MSSLTALPPELLLNILSYLSPSSRTSLLLVSKHFRRWATSKIPSASEIHPSARCEYLALTRYIAEYALLRHDRRRCVICSAVLARDFFHSEVTPICKWHDGWFMALQAPVALEQRFRDMLTEVAQRGKTRWVATTRKYCVHQREVVEWHVENCGCRCGSCGHFDVTCYVRISARDDKPMSWHLRIDDSSTAIVVEKRGWIGGNGQACLSDLTSVEPLELDLLRICNVEVPVVRVEEYD